MAKATKIKIRKEEGRDIRFYDVYTAEYIDRILRTRGFGGGGTGGGGTDGVDDIGGLGREIGVTTEDLNGVVTSFGVRLKSAISAGRDYFVVSQEREIFVFTPNADVNVGEGTVTLGDDEAVIIALSGSIIFEQSAQQEAENREFRERIIKLNLNLEELEEDLENLNDIILPELDTKLETLDGYFENPNTIPSNYTFFEGIVTNAIWAQQVVATEGWFDNVFTNTLMADRIITNHIGADQVTANKIDVDDLAANNAFIGKLFAREIALVLDTTVSPAKGGLIRSTAFDGGLSSSNIIDINDIGTQGWGIDYGGNAVFHNGFFRGTVIVEGGNATTFADVNITIFASGPTGPTVRPDTKPLVVGDTWIDTADDNRTYHWTGSAWQESDQYVAERGNVSVTIRKAPPSPTVRPDGTVLVVGDIWVDTADGDKPRTWNGVSWVEMYTRIDGGSIVTGRIRSLAYQAGVQGWDIDLDGSVEFNGGTFRGRLIVQGSDSNVPTDDDLDTEITGVQDFLDGNYSTIRDVLSAKETAIIVNGEIVSSYNKLNANSDLVNPAKSSLTTAYNNYITAYNEFITATNNPPSATVNPSTWLSNAQSKLSTLRTRINQFVGAYEDAIDSIGGKRQDDTKKAVNVTIRKNGPTGPATRNDGTARQIGDTWVETNQGNRTYTWTGTTWVQNYTIIDGGNISTGTINAARVSIGTNTTYEADYDPSTKETPAGSQSKADGAESNAKSFARQVQRKNAPAPNTRTDGSALVSGDIWINTADGDKPHSWNGTAWIQQYTIIDGGNITTGAIKSENFNTGVSGWQIDTNADAEFNDVTIRGAIIGGAGPSTTLDNLTVIGTLLMGTPNGEITNADEDFLIDSNGFTIKNSIGTSPETSGNQITFMDGADIGGALWGVGKAVELRSVNGPLTLFAGLAGRAELIGRDVLVLGQQRSGVGGSIDIESGGAGNLTLSTAGESGELRFKVNSTNGMNISGLPTFNVGGTNNIWRDSSGYLRIT